MPALVDYLFVEGMGWRHSLVIKQSQSFLYVALFNVARIFEFVVFLFLSTHSQSVRVSQNSEASEAVRSQRQFRTEQSSKLNVELGGRYLLHWLFFWNNFFCQQVAFDNALNQRKRARILSNMSAIFAVLVSLASLLSGMFQTKFCKVGFKLFKTFG